jgi:hypothetical protein
MHKCPTCGAENAIVNQCRCDPNNLPTRVPTLEQVVRQFLDEFRGEIDNDEPMNGGDVVDKWVEYRQRFYNAIADASESTPNGYDRRWIEAINTALEDREVERRIVDLDDGAWERWIAPVLDFIEHADLEGEDSEWKDIIHENKTPTNPAD